MWFFRGCCFTNRKRTRQHEGQTQCPGWGSGGSQEDTQIRLRQQQARAPQASAAWCLEGGWGFSRIRTARAALLPERRPVGWMAGVSAAEQPSAQGLEWALKEMRHSGPENQLQFGTNLAREVSRNISSRARWASWRPTCSVPSSPSLPNTFAFTPVSPQGYFLGSDSSRFTTCCVICILFYLVHIPFFQVSKVPLDPPVWEKGVWQGHGPGGKPDSPHCVHYLQLPNL